MDVRIYKLATPVTAPWPGSAAVVRLHPVSQATAQAVEVTALDEPWGAARVARRAAARVAAALEPAAGTEDVLRLTDPAGLAALYSWCLHAQRRATPDLAALREWLRKSVIDVPEVLEDGAVAWHSGGPADYYGRPVSELTLGQVAWYLCLKDAFGEFHVGGHDDRGRPTRPKAESLTLQFRRRWLDPDRKERKQWKMRD